MNFRTNYNQELFPPSFEVQEDKTILTLPDQSMTLQEILARVQRGQNTGNYIDGTYNVDNDIDDFDAEMPEIQDLTDIDEIQRNVNDTFKRHQKIKDDVTKKQNEVEQPKTEKDDKVPTDS